MNSHARTEPPRGFADQALAAAASIAIVFGLAGHAMWRDELLSWMIAATADSPLELFRALHYDGHPGLWHLLLWPLTRITDDPRAMQAVHGVIALGAVGVIALRSPFSRLERALLLGGYFLVFEYSLVSRNYAIGLLLGLLHVRLIGRAPPWVHALLLGLMANSNLYAAILSGVLALDLAARLPWRERLRAAPIYAALALLALATVWPAADISREITSPLANLWSPGHFARMAVRFVGVGLAPVRATPDAWTFLLDPPNRAELLPWLIPSAALLGLALWSLAPRMRWVFLLTVTGAVLFGHLVYAVAVRHWGIVWLAWLLCWWRSRAEGADARAPALIILALGLIGGAQSLHVRSMPFSAAKTTAAWLDASDIRDLPMVGVPDGVAAAVAAYRARPIAMPECRCVGRRAVFSNARDGFARADLVPRVRALALGPAVLVTTWDLTETERVGLAARLIHADLNAWTDERFRLYRLDP